MEGLVKNNMNFFLFLLLFILTIIVVFCLIVFIDLIIYIRKHHIKISLPVPIKKRGKLRRLFIDLPRCIARDIANNDPNEFKVTGFHCFCGEQGSGKTISMVQKIRQLKLRYPKVKVLSNFDCEFSDGVIESWKDIVFNNNGKEGIIIALDEIQNWFSTNESKDFPPEMLQEITQQRKQRKMIIATSQRFQRLAKPLREQINTLYEPFTIFGVLTFVRVRKPFVDDDGQLDRKKSSKRGTYFFVHSDELRSSYDTLQKIQRQANGGYKDSPFNSDNNISTNIAIDISSKARRKL